MYSPSASRILWLSLGILPSVAKHGKGDDGDVDPDEDDDAVPPGSADTSTPAVPSAQPLSTSSASNPSTAPSSTASSSPIQLLQPGNVTSCQDLILRWESNTATVPPLTLMVTNDRAVAASLGESSVDGMLVSHTVASNLPASTTQYNWSPVDVPQGTYVVLALDASHMLGQSPPFTVLAGQNASCLNPGSTSTSLNTSSLPNAGPTTILGSSSSVPAASSLGASDTRSKSLSPGALGGTIAGIAVAITLLLLAFTFPYYRRNALTQRPRNSRPGGPYYLF